VQKAGTRELRNWLNVHPNLTGHSAELGYLDMVGCTRESDRRAEPEENKVTIATICNQNSGPVTAAMLSAAKKTSKRNKKTRKRTPRSTSDDNDGGNTNLPVGAERRRGTRTTNHRIAARAAEHDPKFNETNPPDNRYFWRGYLDRFPAFDHVQQRTQLTFEKTPKYVEMATSRIVRLQQTFPSMKLLLVLRDPVSRAYSWYNMVCSSNESSSSLFGASGFAEILEGKYKGEIWAIRRKVEKVLGLIRSRSEPKPEPKYKWRKLKCSPETFEQFILQGFANRTKLLRGKLLNKVPRLAKFNGVAERSGSHEPLVRGHYADQLKRWMKIFPREQFHVLTMDELLKNSVITMQEIESFLGIPNFPYASHFGVSRTGSTIFNGVHSKIERPYKAHVQPMTNLTNTLLQKYFGAKHPELLRVIGRQQLPWGQN
jgi:hypothetical protein